jgi:excisionase family DNA binding protein
LASTLETARNRLFSGLPMSTGQAAALVGVDAKTVANWIRQGKVTATQTPGGQYRISADEVRRVILGAAA